MTLSCVGRAAAGKLSAGVWGPGALGTGFGGGALVQTWHLCGACGSLKPQLQGLVALVSGDECRRRSLPWGQVKGPRPRNKLL